MNVVEAPLAAPWSTLVTEMAPVSRLLVTTADADVGDTASTVTGFGTMDTSSQPAGMPVSVSVQTVPVGMLPVRADQLLPELRTTSWSYASPGQSTCTVNSVPAPAGSPCRTLLILRLPWSRVLLTVLVKSSHLTSALMSPLTPVYPLAAVSV